ncbi:hypothetical protein BGZ93_001713 [Podila epicladia]|nr:hypothetical protein BGZ93_001713 [Podila epicladia]
MEERLSIALSPAPQALNFYSDNSNNNSPLPRQRHNRRIYTDDYGKDFKYLNTQGLMEKPHTVLSLEDENHGHDHNKSGSKGTGVPATITRTVITIRILVIINLIFLFSRFYLKALAGGDLDWVKSNLSILGLNLMLSILCLTAAITLVTVTPMSSVLAGLLYLGVAIILLVLKTWDNGESFEAHGAYNMLVFMCLNKDKNLQPTYDILPDTKGWPIHEKLRHTYNKKIIERIEKRPYMEPVLVNSSGIEAIVANCNENVSKVLIRLTRQENVLDRVETVQRTQVIQEEDLIFVDEHQTLINSLHEDESVNRKITKDTKEMGDRKPNILILFMDAVGRRQFYRKLAKTAAIISDLTVSGDEDDAQGRPQLHEFFRYHAIGLNTEANSRAIYTNHAEALNPSALPIWKDFHDAGYITSNVENSCQDWSTHYTGLVTSQYFDHELHTPFCLPPYFALTGNQFGNFNGPYSIVRRCLHGDNIHNHAFKYMNQFMKAYPDKPWFQLGSFIEGHEGTGEVLLTIDYDLAKFIKGMEEDGTLNNTVVFIMADHGLHMGINFLFTQNGRIEHMNPYLSVILPPLLTKKYPSLARGLRHNQQSLVTGYEIHTTLKLLASGKVFSPARSNGEDKLGEGKSWGKGTLFDEELNKSRSCDQARIPDEAM